MSADLGYRAGHGDLSFHVEHYDLDLAYRVRGNHLTGRARLDVRALAETSVLHLDLARLQVRQVEVAGARLVRHRHRSGRLVLQLAAPVQPGQSLRVEVRYGGVPHPSPSPWGPVGWEELADGVLVASQPTGAPSWFPCNDRPDDKATFRTTVTVDAPYRVVAHGELVRRRTRSSTSTWVFDQRRPTSPYLATVHIGRFEEVPLAEGGVPQTLVAPAALLPLARRRLADHGRLMTFLEEHFGSYPFDGYRVVLTPDELDIPVEAQGMAIFGANHLAAGQDHERLVPHELAHQWFGNSLSVAGWQDLWLNEGFGCYAEWLWSPQADGPATDQVARRWWARLDRLPQDLVLADPGPTRVFDDRVYKRGALALHALRLTLGDDVFWPLVRDWTTRFAHGVVSTELFRTHVASAAGPAAARAAEVLEAWLDRPGLPPLPQTLRR